jgi:acid phosphatase (class A)
MCLRERASGDIVASEYRAIKWLQLFLTIFILFVSVGPLPAQNLPSGAAGSPRQLLQTSGAGSAGFLGKNELSYLSLIPPYPALQSLGDAVDAAVVRQWQSVDSARWQLANADASLSYNRFSEAFGGKIDATATPLLVHLLDRVQADLSILVTSAKTAYNRPRPYQRFQMTRVCGFDTAPSAEASPKGGNSYPSGHTSFGWSVALVLAETVPERAQIILARGREYGESRVVCAMHYPSDVHAAEILVSAVVGRLHAVPEFKRELSCAQEEHAVALKARNQLGPDCLILKQELEPKP